MSTLNNFPFVNQLADGDPNNQFDCVPASIAASIQYLTGQQVSSSTLKDAVYGNFYVGGTSIDAYVQACVPYGVRLSAIGCSSPQDAIQHAHSMLAQGHPVIFTQQDDYAPSHPEWTHVCVWYSDDTGSLTAMDPFGGKALMYSDGIWAQRLRDNTIWIMERQMIPTGWSDDGTTLTAPNGVKITDGFRSFVLSYPGGWPQSNIPLQAAQGLSQLELSNPSLGGGTQQIFLKTVLEWTNSTGVFVQWCGQEIIAMQKLLLQQKSQIDTLNAQVAQLQKTQAPNLIPLLQQYQGLLQQINKLSQIPS
jgi:hypothetical protein